MNCTAFSALLDNYSNLTKEEITMLEEHAAVCDKCRQELEFFRSIIDVTASLPQLDPPADLLDKINDEIDSSKPALFFNKMYYNIKTHVKQYSTVAACLLIGLIVGLNNSSIKEMLHDKPTYSNDEAKAPVAETSKPDDIPVFNESPQTEPPSVQSKDFVKSAAEIPSKMDSIAAPETGVSIPARSEATSRPAVSKNNTIINNTEKTPATNKITESSKGSNTLTEENKTESIKEPTVVQTQNPQLSYLPENEEEQTITAETSENESENTIERYTLEQNEYSIRDDEYAYSEPTPAPTEEIAVDDYEIADTQISMAMTDSKEGIYDRLIILQGDTEAVFSILSRHNISYIGPYYKASLVEFHEVLNALDSEGIYYSYTCMRGEEAVVLFTVGR